MSTDFAGAALTLLADAQDIAAFTVNGAGITTVAQAEFNGGYSAAPCLSEWVEVKH